MAKSPSTNTGTEAKAAFAPPVSKPKSEDKVEDVKSDAPASPELALPTDVKDVSELLERIASLEKALAEKPVQAPQAVDLTPKNDTVPELTQKMGITGNMRVTQDPSKRFIDETVAAELNVIVDKEDA